MWFGKCSLRARSRARSAALLACLAVGQALLLWSPGGNRFSSSSAAAGAPMLQTQTNSTRAIALDSVTGLAEPFQLQTAVAFGSDARTRVMLFARQAAAEESADRSAHSKELRHLPKSDL
jgi:hypothetical protein